MREEKWISFFFFFLKAKFLILNIRSLFFFYSKVFFSARWACDDIRSFGKKYKEYKVSVLCPLSSVDKLYSVPTYI